MDLFVNTGETSFPNETEMRKLIERSLITNGAAEENVQVNLGDNTTEVENKDLHLENWQTQQHYESNCVVESKSYFGTEFDSEKHNSELVYDDLPKPITEFNKSVVNQPNSNDKAINGTKCKESSR